VTVFKPDEPDTIYTIPGKKFTGELQVEVYKHVLPAVHDIEGPERFEKFHAAFNTTVIGFFHGNRTTDPHVPAFIDVAESMRGRGLFAACWDGCTPESIGLPRFYADAGVVELANETGRPPFVLVLKPAENRSVEFNGDLASDLGLFSKVLSLPLLGSYDFHSRQQYRDAGVPVGMLWVSSHEFGVSGSRGDVILRNLAQRHAGAVSMVKLNASADGILMRMYGLEPWRLPAFGIADREDFYADRFAFRVDPEQHEAFWEDPGRASQELSKFCDDYRAKKLEPSHETLFLNSNYTWQPGHVQEVVWGTYQRDVNHSTQDILLELYSPQRDNHHTQTAVMQVVAHSLRSLDLVKVARMDASQNWVPPGLTTRARDSITADYFVITGNITRRVVKFRGISRVLEHMPERLLRFLHEQSTLEWELDPHLPDMKLVTEQLEEMKGHEEDAKKAAMQEWIEHEKAEFRRLKGEGKFDGMDLNLDNINVEGLMADMMNQGRGRRKKEL